METSNEKPTALPENGASEAKAPEAPNYVLPSLDKGAASFFDPESKTYWIGIPLDRTDILDALAVVDSTKLDLLMKWKANAIAKAEAEQARSKIVKPGWAEKARQNGAALLQKLKV